MLDTFVPFPLTLKFGVTPETEMVSSKDTIHVDMLDCPTGDFRRRVFNMVQSTWQDDFWRPTIPPTEENIAQVFDDLLAGKVLPNSMESMYFLFRVDGITLIEITHILRHRTFSSIHAQCTADRFLTEDSAMIPSGIENSRFAERYTELTHACKDLYQEMVDSKDVSIMDARYILPRNSRYFYTFGMNLKDAIMFIKQRRCTAIQPELDNEIAKQMYVLITSVIPELKKYLSLECDHTCHTTFGNDKHTTRLYQPDENHARIMEAAKRKRGEACDLNPKNFVYAKTREQMGSFYTDKDKHVR